ncbi:NDP-hexose 2,3-dehydratase family protein [Filifactor villosus]|uniref:NDP-hexose 2,3-dehydratase family protein n=1 Tax=Filifactor villosus TaxID=29374 RepID=A0ABV9QKR7_9FIRM
MRENIKDILSWVDEKNRSLEVNIYKKTMGETVWFLDGEGVIRNKDNSFFQIRGLKVLEEDRVVQEQPIIIQDEIGYLGIICKEFDHRMYFLMQAKIEPGNINKIQISPTIQATKSNFTQKHGGKKPAYLEYFLDARHRVLVDQIQSEQSSRFLGKRNRNIIILVEDEVRVLPSHKWMSLDQIKELMKIDNLVNMDTRTVLSCLPYLSMSERERELLGYPRSEELKKSLYEGDGTNHITEIYKYINDYKMFDLCRRELLPLSSLDRWEWKKGEFVHKEGYPFKVIFCEIEIEGREVRKWTQPLFEANGKAIFGLLTRLEDGMTKFLVKARSETGCFDKIELGPSVQLEADYSEDELDVVEKLFFERWKGQQNIRFDTVLSEEGGRFYHEQNHNVIIEIEEELRELPQGYFWVDYKTLAELIMVNNVLNIQLRNLLSVLEA